MSSLNYRLAAFEHGGEGTGLTLGPAAAEVFASIDNEPVVLLERLEIAVKVSLEERAELFVGRAIVGEAVSLEHAAGVGVDDEDGLVAGVEQDVVCGFWANACNT